MNKVLVVAAGIALLGLVTGCTTQEGTKTQPAKTAKVQPAKTEAAKTEAAKAQPAKAETPAKKPVKIEYVDTPSGRWRVHDVNRPAPAVITPGEGAKAPSDAIVLFDGTDVSKWTDGKGQPSKWIVRDGFMESVKGAGYIQTAEPFGSCQLHVEFATPERAIGTSQGRGNSGVFLQGEYEVQVLDSYENKTYPDGQCAALYGRAVPLVNVCRKPGEWQTYDIVYHRPLFGTDGKVTRKATFTVFQNGVLVQDHVALEGGTGWDGPHAVTPYRPIKDKGPIMLQDHGNPVRYRNIWIRPLQD
ncbi:MAG: hypothetical protein A2Y76_00530 [Planctomycetes bacterium RBG_13_60_9]|nr:MAG: hypothetical protein A2Y76_00530 [Planctomycetes bacterium RBG_13_60_9]